MRRSAYPEDTRGVGALAIFVVLLAHAIRYASFQITDAHTYADGYYTWIFARSLAFDGDLDLTNDYRMCGDPWHLGGEMGGHRPANPFYFGPALFLGPLLFVLKLIVRMAPTAPAAWREGCSGPLVAYVGIAAPIACAATVWLGYRIARRWYSERSSALAVLVIGLASPLNVFGTLTWYYSHLWAALAVGIALLCALRAAERPEDHRRWLIAGATAGLAGVMRPQEGLWGLVGAAAIAAVWQSDRSTLVALKRLAFLVIGFGAVFWIQLYVYQKLYGSPFVVPQGKLYVQLGHAHPWLLLFSARSGLLYWTPLIWLSVLGLPLLVADGRRRLFTIALVVAMVLNFYVSSATLSWTGSATIGARVQTSLAPALVLATAAALSWVEKWTVRRRFTAGTVALLATLPWIYLTWEIGPAGLPNDRPVQAPQLYGTAITQSFTWVYAKTGNPWTFPASAVFWLRYRAPPSAFDALATDGMFMKEYRNTSPMGPDTFSFTHPPPAYWATGFVPWADETAVIAARPGRFLVTLYWPWVSVVRLKAHPATPARATVHIKASSFFRTREIGTLVFDHDDTLELRAPDGAFDSGINEVQIETDTPLVVDTWQWVDTMTHDTGVRLFP